MRMISIVYESLPDEISGITVFDEEDDYIVIINSKKIENEQLSACQIELDKIERGFYVEDILKIWYCDL